MAFNFLKKLLQKLRRPGMEISYSRISAYRFCPWKYRILYIEGMKVPPNAPISFGLSIHRALEDFHRSGGKTFEALMDSYDRAWVNEGFMSPQQTQEYYERGETMLKNYFAAESESKAEFLEAEKQFSFPMGKNRLRGIIDRIDRHPDGRCEIIDYKTHVDPWSQTKVDEDIQLSIYCLAANEALGIKDPLLTYYFLYRGKRISTVRDARQLAAAKKLIAETAGKILKQEFPPNTANCHYCDFKKSCRHSTQKAKQKPQTTK